MKKSKIISLNVAIYCFVCVLLTLDLFLSAYLKINKYEEVLRYSTVIVIVALFVINRDINLKDILFFLLFIILFFQKTEASINLAYLLLLSLSAKYVENEKLYRIINLLNLLIFIAIVFFLSTGIVKNEVIYKRNRNTLGFVHVNYVGMLCYSFVSSYILWRKEIKKTETLLITVFIVAVVIISDSRTGCFGALFLLLVYYFVKYCKEPIRKILIYIYTTLIVCFPFLIKLPIFLSGKMNLLFTYRPIKYQNYINSCTIKQFVFGGAHTTVDCFYIAVLFGCGIFIYLIICVLFYHAIKTNLNNSNYIELSFILTTMLIGTMETSLMRPEILYVVIFWKLLINTGGENEGLKKDTTNRV